jgi:hypothetical protein
LTGMVPVGNGTRTSPSGRKSNARSGTGEVCKSIIKDNIKRGANFRNMFSESIVQLREGNLKQWSIP